MAPKRRRDAVAKEIPKTYTFGRSLIDEGDITDLQKSHDWDHEGSREGDRAEAPQE
jgi:hypothetical protein